MSRDRTRTRERTDEASATRREGAPDDRSASAVATSTEVRQEESRGSDTGRVARARSRATRIVAPRAFLATLLATVVGLVVGTAILPLPGAGLVGVFLGAFAVGLVGERRRYLEATLAGGLAFGAAGLFQYAVIAALGGLGFPIVAVSGAVGALVGGLGHYFGRDLRDGLTREL